jgi:rare lipoprotein A (peptidoglycan hydrolase)
MKKFWLAILALTLVSACSSPPKKPAKRTYAKKKESSGKRIQSKYSDYVKPSESMQAGLPKTTSYVFKKPDSTVESSSDDLELVDADTANFVGDDGKYSGIFKVGNPYEIFGVNYIPQNYEDYEEIGTASWYGDDFHGKATANGETYNMGSMTAAHPTLPLPSLVRVTNLRNNKSVIVRVNDRGPFAKNRVIDVSEKAATLLEFKGQGTTEVKVELLRNDTDRMLEKLKIKN